MKKLCILMLLCLGFLLTACTGDPVTDNSISLPDLANKTVQEARLIVAGNYIIKTEEIEDYEFLPGRIIGYKDKKPGDKVDPNTEVTVIVARKPGDTFTLSENEIMYVRTVSWVTGPDSAQNWGMLLPARAQGTDLGFPVEVDGKIIYLFGDTNPPGGSGWYSNFIAVSEDYDFYDGITFSDLITHENGVIKPFFEGKHQANNEFDLTTEVTKIPTGGIQIGDYVYIFFMSIRYWGVPGEWLVTYNQAVKSHKDDLSNWEIVDGLRFDEVDAPNFGQIFPMKDPKSDYVYLFSIPGGRSGGCVLSRVLEADFENKDEYEHFTNSGWIKGDAGLVSLKNNVRYIITPGVSEISVFYNHYIGQYMAVYLKNSNIIYITTPDLTQSWSKAVIVTNDATHSGLYAGCVGGVLTAYDGQKIYMMISRWHDYNVQLIEVVLN